MAEGKIIFEMGTFFKSCRRGTDVAIMEVENVEDDTCSDTISWRHVKVKGCLFTKLL